jgi:hypothetical protein
LKLSTTWKTFLAHTSNFNVETPQQLEEFFFHTFSQTTTLKPLNNSKNYFFYRLSQTATLKPLNNLKNFFFHILSQTATLKPLNNSKNPLSHILNLNLKLKDLKNTLPHLKTYNTLKKSLPHLPLIWKSCKLLVCHHLEMNSHSLCKLKNLFQKDSFLFLCNTSSKFFTTSCFNTMFFLLFSATPT